MSGLGFGGRKIASIWAPASQESSHVGHAGVGVVSLRGAPLSLPSFATARFQSFFDCGRALRCVLPLGGGRIMHLVVLYGYQGPSHQKEEFRLHRKKPKREKEVSPYFCLQIPQNAPLAQNTIHA